MTSAERKGLKMATDDTAPEDRVSDRSSDRVTGRVADLAAERRLKTLMSAVEPQEPETIDVQVAVALSEFRRAAKTRRSAAGFARASVAAAILGLFAAGGWWLRGMSSDSPAVAAGNIRPVRGLTSPCPTADGVYLGSVRLGELDVAVYVEMLGADVSVRLVDPIACTEVSMLPAPSPGR